MHKSAVSVLNLSCTLQPATPSQNWTVMVHGVYLVQKMSENVIFMSLLTGERHISGVNTISPSGKPERF